MILTPGGAPPFVIPYCSICELPVDKFAFVGGRVLHRNLVIASPRSAYYVEIEAQCCNKTMGRRMSVDEILRMKATGEKIFVVVKKGRFQGIGSLRRGV